MQFSVRDIKKVMYAIQALFGGTLFVLGVNSLRNYAPDLNGACSLIVGAILTLVGCGTLFFSCETLMLGDDDDVWR